VEHFIFAFAPKYSARVKRSKQSINVFGGPYPCCTCSPKSNDMSQNGSIVVETLLQDWHTTSLCKPPVNIYKNTINKKLIAPSITILFY